MSKPTARELIEEYRTHTVPSSLRCVEALAARVEKVLEAHKAGGGWACELCQTHLPCPTVRILNGESE